jgi:hypothetical protein
MEPITSTKNILLMETAAEAASAIPSKLIIPTIPAEADSGKTDGADAFEMPWRTHTADGYIVKAHIASHVDGYKIAEGPIAWFMEIEIRHGQSRIQFATDEPYLATRNAWGGLVRGTQDIHLGLGGRDGSITARGTHYELSLSRDSRDGTTEFSYDIPQIYLRPVLRAVLRDADNCGAYFTPEPVKKRIISRKRAAAATI